MNRSSGKGWGAVRASSGFALAPYLMTLRSAPWSASPPRRCHPLRVEACKMGSYRARMSDKVRNMHRWVARRGHAGQGWCACMCDARYAYLSPSEKRQPASQSGKFSGQRAHLGPLPPATRLTEMKYVRIFRYSRVANVLTFPTVSCSPENSKGVAIGEGVPVSGTASLGPGSILPTAQGRGEVPQSVRGAC